MSSPYTRVRDRVRQQFIETGTVPEKMTLSREEYFDLHDEMGSRSMVIRNDNGIERFGLHVGGSFIRFDHE